METGLSQGEKAWSRDPKFAYFEILQNRDHYQQFSKTEFLNFYLSLGNYDTLSLPIKAEDYKV